MRSYVIEGEGIRETIKIDNRERSLIFSWANFQLLNEVLNGYTKNERRPPRDRVQKLQTALCDEWHSQDVEIPEREY